MANPAPFAPTSYDNPDWVRQVTLVSTASGTPTSTAFGGGTPVANNGFSTARIWTDTSPPSDFFFGPSDFKQHYLITAQIVLNFNALNVTGTARFIVQAVDATNLNSLIYCEVVASGIPTADRAPQQIATMTWPGGYAVTPNVLARGQLQVVPSVTPSTGSTLTSYEAFAAVITTWV